MSGHILRFSDKTHQEVEALLPWFLNKSLDNAEYLLVEEHIRDCSRCQRDLNWLSDLAQAYQQSEISADATSAFNALRPSLRGNRVWSSVSSGLHCLAEFCRRNKPRPILIMAFELAVILGLAGVLALGRQPASFRTLGAAPASANSGRLVVIFSPLTTEQDLRRLVRQVGARIVDGPTRADAYVLELPPDREASALIKFRADPAVALAEQLEGRSVP